MSTGLEPRDFSISWFLVHQACVCSIVSGGKQIGSPVLWKPKQAHIHKHSWYCFLCLFCIKCLKVNPKLNSVFLILEALTAFVVYNNFSAHCSSPLPSIRGVSWYSVWNDSYVSFLFCHGSVLWHVTEKIRKHCLWVVTLREHDNILCRTGKRWI